LLTQQRLVINAPNSDSNKASRSALQGRVIRPVEANQKPIVNVFLNESSFGVITDQNGEFSFSTPSEQVRFLKLHSLESAPLQLSPDSVRGLNILLLPDKTKLSDYVVAEVYVADTIVHDRGLFLAMPALGRKAVNEYVQTNIVYPAKAVENKIEGLVLVEFLVLADGKLDDLKVQKSIGFGCEEEVLRLITHGPAWIPSRLNDETINSKVRVGIRFQLFR